MAVTVLQFSIRLFSALLLGVAVGMERQWRQRMAGMRTNALVAGGASAFVMAGVLLAGDPAAAGRVASYVVSGVGFLGAGVIFKEGGNVRGLNTAATIWCAAAIGVLAGLGYLVLALILAAAVLIANIGLRPLAYRLHPIIPDIEPRETLYNLVFACRESEEAHLRSVLLAAVSESSASLHAIHSEDEESGMRLRADLYTRGRQNDVIEKIALRLSSEPGVRSLSWSIAETTVE